MSFLLFSCEHATCAVPEAWRDLFRGSEEIVQSPEGWEPGALNLAQGFSMKFRTPLGHGDVTRLLIDLDATGDARWSRFSQRLSDAQRTKLIDRHETRHRDFLSGLITEALRRDTQVVHVLVHTDPDETGVVLASHDTDVTGTQWSETWAAELRHGPDPLDVRVTSISPLPAPAAALRASLGGMTYSAIVLRVSQAFFLENRPWKWEKLKKHLIATFATTAGKLAPGEETAAEPA